MLKKIILSFLTLAISPLYAMKHNDLLIIAVNERVSALHNLYLVRFCPASSGCSSSSSSSTTASVSPESLPPINLQNAQDKQIVDSLQFILDCCNSGRVRVTSANKETLIKVLSDAITDVNITKVCTACNAVCSASFSAASEQASGYSFYSDLIANKFATLALYHPTLFANVAVMSAVLEVLSIGCMAYLLLDSPKNGFIEDDED